MNDAHNVACLWSCVFTRPSAVDRMEVGCLFVGPCPQRLYSPDWAARFPARKHPAEGKTAAIRSIRNPFLHNPGTAVPGAESASTVWGTEPRRGHPRFGSDVYLGLCGRFRGPDSSQDGLQNCKCVFDLSFNGARVYNSYPIICDPGKEGKANKMLCSRSNMPICRT